MDDSAFYRDLARFFQFIGEENQEKRRAQRSFDRAQ